MRSRSYIPSAIALQGTLGILPQHPIRYLNSTVLLPVCLSVSSRIPRGSHRGGACLHPPSNPRPSPRPFARPSPCPSPPSPTSPLPECPTSQQQGAGALSPSPSLPLPHPVPIPQHLSQKLLFQERGGGEGRGAGSKGSLSNYTHPTIPTPHPTPPPSLPPPSLFPPFFSSFPPLFRPVANSPAALPAALYFKNVAVAKWRGAGSKGRVQLAGGKEEQEAVRVQLVEVLLRSGEGKILSVLIEAGAGGSAGATGGGATAVHTGEDSQRSYRSGM
ncbi:unnamed protein product [Closterium sp. NIES-53]